MAEIKFPFVIYPEPTGGYVAEIPALNGCLAQGASLDETLNELQVVEELWLETAEEAGISIPVLESEIERVIERLAA